MPTLKNPKAIDALNFLRKLSMGELTEKELRGYDPADVIKLKSTMPESGLSMYRRGIMSAGEDPTRRVIRFVFSTDDVDRAGDIIQPDGIDLTDFWDNPVVPWNHDYDTPAIARVIAANVEGMPNGKRGLVGDVQFAPREQSTFADDIYRMCRAMEVEGQSYGPFIKGASVGIKPLEVLSIDDPEERNRLGLGTWGVVIQRSRMWELSICNIPMNPKTLRKSITRAVELGMLNDVQAQALLGGDTKTVHPVARAAGDETNASNESPAPGYRLASKEEVAVGRRCDECAYTKGNKRCALYGFRFTAGYVCTSYQIRTAAQAKGESAESAGANKSAGSEGIDAAAENVMLAAVETLTDAVSELRSVVLSLGTNVAEMAQQVKAAAAAGNTQGQDEGAGGASGEPEADANSADASDETDATSTLDLALASIEEKRAVRQLDVAIAKASRKPK